jgi:hypothetical protein
MALGYRLPGTKIEEITSPSSVNPSSPQRTPCFIGTASANITVTNEEVTRGSGLTDSLAYTSSGIYEIIRCGSQKGLGNFVEDTHFTIVANQIQWTSTGVMDAGAKYYVTYKYVRPSTDYIYKEFYSYEDVLADLGDNIPANPLVMISNLAFRYYNLPKIATVQVPVGETIDDYTEALDLTKYRDVQTPVCLTTNPLVQSVVVAHVTERSLPVNGRYRMTYLGAPVGTPIGTEDDTDSLRGMAAAIKNERVHFVNATRGLYYYNDPDTGEQASTVVNGSFIAAAIAAYRDSYIYPAASLLNKTVTGIELYDEDYDDYYSEYMLTLAGSSSLYLVAPSGGYMKVIDDLTTDNSTVERNNSNIITAKDYIARDVAIQMDRTFIGSLIKNRPQYGGVVLNYLKTLFKTYLNNNVIEQVGDLKVSLPADRRDTCNIYYSYYAIYVNKLIDGTYSILL